MKARRICGGLLIRAIAFTVSGLTSVAADAKLRSSCLVAPFGAAELFR